VNDKPVAPARALAPAAPAAEHPRAVPTESDLRTLFHCLNNQLGIILAHAELLEARAADDVSRARASQVVSSVLDALGTAKAIRRRTESERLGA
jgi:hypothetical protein